MEQSNGMLKNAVYVLAAVAGAGLIIYGAFFYTKKPGASPQPAQVLPSPDESLPEVAQPVPIDFDEPYLGQKDAPITMIEYGSYLCGHCITFGKETFPKINENYIKTGKVKFIYRSYPPLELGISALCANEQDKFWEYHEYSVNNQIKAEEDLKTFAQAVGLNAEQFNKCLDEKKYNNQAQAWYDAGQSDGVQGTPTFLINGKKLVGGLPYEEFQKELDQALQGK
jgi:protein-disulfide isomerase